VIVPDPSAPPAPKPEAPEDPAKQRNPGLSTSSPPAPGEVLPTVRWAAPTYSDPWKLPSMKRTYHPRQTWVGIGLMAAGAVNVLPVVGLWIASPAHLDARVFAGLIINGGVGLATGIAGFIVTLTAPKHDLGLTPLRLQPAPFVARSGGGLSLQGSF
jgi:hypothetical protein